MKKAIVLAVLFITFFSLSAFAAVSCRTVDFYGEDDLAGTGDDESCSVDEVFALEISSEMNAHGSDPNFSSQTGFGVCCSADSLLDDSLTCSNDNSVFVGLQNGLNSHGEFPIDQSDNTFDLQNNNYLQTFCLNNQSNTINCKALPATDPTPQSYSCLFGLSNETNAQFYSCDWIDNNPGLIFPEFIKVFCTDEGLPQTSEGDVFLVKIDTKKDGVSSNVFFENDIVTADIKIQNTAVFEIDLLNKEVDYSFKSIDGLVSEERTHTIDGSIVPTSLLPGEEYVFSDTFDLSTLGLLGQSAPIGTYIVSATISPYQTATIQEVYLSNNSAQKFVSVVPETENVTIPDNNLLLVPLIALVVVAVIFFNTKKK